MIENNFKTFDGKLLHYYLTESEKPKAVIQIVHGMQEHAGRYIDFMNFLTNNGYNVFASDLRGHGKNIEKIPGHSNGDIFQEIVKDQIEITKFLKEKYHLPVYIFGHSFGSYITQYYLANSNNIVNKAVICGSTYTKNFLYKFAKIVANITAIFKGKEHEAKLIEKLSLKGYGKDFENGNWLSRDEKNWNNYKNNNFCGQPFPVSFYLSLFKNAPKSYKNLNNIKVPILIISGTADPVGNKNASGPKKLYKVYKKAGINVSIKLYLNARHELLNETNKEEVYKDVLNFFNN